MNYSRGLQVAIPFFYSTQKEKSFISSNMNKKAVLLFIPLLLFTAFKPVHKNSPKKYPVPLLLISFDGFRHDYLQKAPTPHMDELVKTGVLSEGMIPIFPSKTFPNHYTLVTGLYPEHSGIVANSFYDPAFKALYKVGTKSVQQGKWYGGEPIWVTAEKQGFKTGSVFWPGSEAKIAGKYPDRYLHYNGSMPLKARVDTAVSWLSGQQDFKADFVTLYFSNTDDYGHLYGPQSDSIKSAISKLDNTIGYLVNRLKKRHVWPNINIIIVSDHGMAQVSHKKVIFLDDLIKLDHVRITSNNPILYLQPSKDNVIPVYRKLKRSEHHYRVYLRSQLPQRWHLKSNKRVADIVMVADLHYQILTHNQFDKIEGKGYLDGGTHGYDNDEPDMYAFFLAHGPSFKRDLIIKPFQNIQIYDLMCKLLDIEPSRNDGTMSRLSYILIN